jgi:hypothetical protein
VEKVRCAVVAAGFSPEGGVTNFVNYWEET